MEWLLIILARLALPILQALPLRWVARAGRWGGAIAWRVDRRHRRVALQNLERCFGAELGPEERLAIAHENFRRIGENYASSVRTAFMTWPQVKPHLEISNLEPVRAALNHDPTRSCIVALGHFGNFELFTWARENLPGVRLATTYRALRQEAATRMLLQIRSRSGCLFFERRRDSAALRAALRGGRVLLGLLADQHDGRGIRVPLMGHDCSTTTAPALFALRYDCPLFTAYCARTSLAQWRLQFGDEIPTRDEQGRRRTLEAIARDMNRSFEMAIRRDPANWFWVHRRWKPASPVASS